MRKLKHLFMLCLFGMVSIEANAYDFEAYDGENYFQYNITSRTSPYTAELVKSIYTIYGSLSIPSSAKPYNGDITYSVTSIAASAFSNQTNMTDLYLPSSIKKIGASAFYECRMTSLTIPGSVTEIDESAFSCCSWLKSITVASNNTVYDSRENCNAIIKRDNNRLIKGCSKTIIPNSVTSIGDYAFNYCGLQSIDIPSSVTSIGDQAFYACTNLKSIDIPHSVTEIGTFTFSNCSALTDVTIPNSVTKIGSDAFSYCGNLPATQGARYADTFLAAVIDRTRSTLTIKEGTKWIGSDAIANCSNLTSIEIPHTVTMIGKRAFYGCSGLKSVTIPNLVTSIGDYAFSECSDLESVTIGNSVALIGNDAFLSCKNLKSVTIPNSVTSIGNSAFSGCISLTNVAIPNSVTSIGDNAFRNCSDLASVTVEWNEADKIPEIGDNTFPYASCVLYVPAGTRKAYLEKNFWKTFKEIRVYGTNISVIDFNDTDSSFDLESGENFTLNDNIKRISITAETQEVNVSYTRNFVNADVWQAWYMPFDVAFDDMKDAYDVAQIHGVLLDKDNNAVLAFLKLDDGTIKANTPYVVRPKASGEVVIKTTTDLQPTVSKSFDLKSATDIYYLGGVYEQTTTPGNWYALNLDGQFQLMDNGVYLRPFRIYMSINPREDNPYATSATANAKMDIVVLGDDGEVTGIKSLTPTLSEGEGAIYNLNGQRVTSITSGQIYIMNGKKYIAK